MNFLNDTKVNTKKTKENDSSVIIHLFFVSYFIWHKTYISYFCILSEWRHDLDFHRRTFDSNWMCRGKQENPKQKKIQEKEPQSTTIARTNTFQLNGRRHVALFINKGRTGQVLVNSAYLHHGITTQSMNTHVDCGIG